MIQYPNTAQGKVVDDYHGQKIADPYRWLEDVESEATEAWVTDQNQVTRQYLDGFGSRQAMRDRLEKLWNYERYGIPVVRGDWIFYTHNDGLQNQSLLYKASGLDASREILLDPNQLSDDGTVSLAGWQPSDDGQWVAYALADGGSDWRTWRVRNTASGKDLNDAIQWVKFSGIAWAPDQKGFYYARYAAPKEGKELTGTNYHQKLYFHLLGTPQTEDQLVYERPDHKEWGFHSEVSQDGRWLVIQNWKGSEPQSQIFIKDLNEPSQPIRPLISGFDAEYQFIAADQGRLFFVTDDGAPRKRVISVLAEQPTGKAWQEVIPESDDVLESVQLLGNRFFASYLKDARTAVKVYSLAGKLEKELTLPGLGSANGFGGQRDATDTFFAFNNYVTLPSIYRFNLDDDQTVLWRRSEVDFDSQAYQTTQHFYHSKDGTRVPMIVTHRKGIVLDGSHPTLLYGYGGFNISLTPQFSPAVAAWLESGGIYAVPNLRGGGEYGRPWHEAGMCEQKQNVFDDFIAAAEFLIDQGYTRSNRLGIRGGSNGGLLVGAVMTQRPELFGACLPAVGVMDMLRFHKFTIGWAWVTEFGSSDDPKQFKNLLRYSPLHSIKPDTCYPPTLITTADRDDRVVPGHSFKFAAALQASQACEHPVLIRIETRAGHGAGTPVSKSIDEYADLWTFLKAHLR